MKRSRALLLLLALICLSEAARATRDGVFVGYKEVGVQGEEAGGDGGDGGVEAGAGDGQGDDVGDKADMGGETGAALGGQGSEDGSLFAAAEGAGGAGGGAAAGQQGAEKRGRTVLLHTQFGPIRVHLLEELAPRTTALVWDLAQRRGCNDCAFYR